MSEKTHRGQVVEWITTEDACERLGKTARTLERLQIIEGLKTKLEPVAGRKPRRLWYAPQIEGLASEREGKRRARVQALTQPNGVARRASAETQVLGELLRELVESRRQAIAPVRQLWLTVKQAVEFSGLSQKDIRELAQSGEITSRKSGRSLRIRRVSLEAFEGK